MNNSGHVFRVGISGSYGGLNLGDEAILQVIVDQLRRSIPVEITVFSRNPADTLSRHKVDRVVPVRDLSRTEVVPEVERLDLLIIGGGGILYDAEVEFYLREVLLAHERDVPVMVYAVGAGPLQDPAAQRLVRTCLNRAASVTVRERRARQVLEQVGVTADIQVTADPALLLEPEPLPQAVIESQLKSGRDRLVGFSVREPGGAAPDIDERHYHALLANAADFMVDRLDADLVFIPMERVDVQHSHAVISQMAWAERATVIKGEFTSGQVLSLVGRLTFAVGMRLHFLMFAAIQRVPFVALPYAGKVAGFLEALEMAGPPVQRVDAGRLIAHVDRTWDARSDLQTRIDRTIPMLQERARETNGIAVQLLERRHADPDLTAPKVVG
ncbi:MAG: polysaccharide pyruvyl transferase family protein [Dehalococcoidia bacterium]